MGEFLVEEDVGSVLGVHVEELPHAGEGGEDGDGAVV